MHLHYTPKDNKLIKQMKGIRPDQIKQPLLCHNLPFPQNRFTVMLTPRQKFCPYLVKHDLVLQDRMFSQNSAVEKQQ